MADGMLGALSVFSADGGYLVHDPVHGAISLPKVCKHIIDHKYFQRMRRIKQLGAPASYRFLLFFRTLNGGSEF